MKKDIETLTKNNHNNSSYYLTGSLMEYFFPYIGALTLLLSGAGTTWFSKPLGDKRNGFETPSNEMMYISVKNAGKTLIGATAISALRYFF